MTPYREARLHPNMQIFCAGCPTAIAERDFEDGDVVVRIPTVFRDFSRRQDGDITIFYMSPSRRKRYRQGRRADLHMGTGSGRMAITLALADLPVAVECWVCKAQTVSLIDREMVD